jgi:hypothetical protein
VGGEGVRDELVWAIDPSMLDLYKKLCRYYFKIDPEATASYVYAYRDMWDEEERVMETRISGNKMRKRKGYLALKVKIPFFIPHILELDL